MFSEKARHKRIHIIKPIYIKCSEKGNRKLISGSPGTGDGKRDEWILWGDGNVLKLGCGGDCTTQQIYYTRNI